jgi:hypothetical protein
MVYAYAMPMDIEVMIRLPNEGASVTSRDMAFNRVIRCM